jgi:hypothetical protein
MKFAEFKESLYSVFEQGGVDTSDKDFFLNKEYYLLENFYKEKIEPIAENAAKEEAAVIKEELPEDLELELTNAVRNSFKRYFENLGA